MSKESSFLTAHGSTSPFLSVRGSVSRSSINPQTSPYAVMHHFTPNNHSYSKPLIQLVLSSCLWQQLSHPAIQRNTAGVEKPSGGRYPTPPPRPLHLLPCCPRWQWQKSVIATSSDGFIKTSIVCAAERRWMGKRGNWAEERREPTMQLLHRSDRWGLQSSASVGPWCMLGSRGRHTSFFTPPSLVGNDWIILQMNRCTCLAHKHFLAILIKTIKAV